MDPRQIRSALDKLQTIYLIRALEKLTVRNYDPDQPRDPKGTPTGGQWTSGGSYKKFDNSQSIRAWVDQYRYNIIPKLTEKQRERLYQYKTSSRYYVPLNEYLRTGQYDDQKSAWKNTAEMRSAMTAMDNALARTRIPENITVFRGMPADVLPEDAVGAEFIDYGYGSTSLDFNKAATFASWTREDGFLPAIVEIRVPKGTQGIYMDELWDNGDYELLLPRGTTYRILADDRQSDVRYLLVEVVT